MVRIFVKGGVWKNSEDEVLKAAVMKYGINNWSRVASLLVRKSAKQCKARWYEWLDPSVKKTEWTREEEEKLLHLAKLFPTQWRTIAPIVGRTAHQCLEHYEKLLDQAQGNDEEEGKRKSLVPTIPHLSSRTVSGLRGRLEDPRRLRPGEIDPHPETKPSRADAIDMQDDEKEMLQEARARLANTRGKKAKRKAREKQLEEARRLAALQKRRELKAAGLITSLRPRKRRRDMDYGVDIPFEEKPPPGFHAVGAEENPEANINFANISLQQLEGTMRAQEEMKLRKEDARKLKRLQEENLPLYLQQLEERRKLEMLRQKQKLNLPDPALQEHELEEIIRVGAEAAAVNAAAGTGGPTNKLLAGSSTSVPGGATPLTVGGMSLATMRTPRREDVILMEAANAVMTINQTTPLEGGENFQLHETAMKTAAAGSKSFSSHMQQRTPNLLQQRLLLRDGGGTTGLSSLRATPFTAGEDGSITPRAGTSHGEGSSVSAAESGGMGEKARLSLARLQICSSLATLPTPQNDVEPALPTREELAALDERLLQQAEIEEDMEDILRRRRLETEAAQQAEWLRQSQAVQQHLPRPYVLPAAAAAAVPPLPCFYADEQQLQQQLLLLVQQEGEQPTEAQLAEVARGLKEAEKLMNQEMMTLLCYDAFKHPFKGSQPSSSAPELLKLDDALLHEAREMLKCEGQLLQHQSEVGEETSTEENKLVAKAFENAQDAYVYLPSAKSFQLYHNLSREERLEALRCQFEDLRKQVDATAHRSKKAQKKYVVLTKGYESKAKDLTEKIEEAYREYELQAANLNAFQSLHEQEKRAIVRRGEEQQNLLVQERGKHLWMQRRYAELQRQKEQLQSFLAGRAGAADGRTPNNTLE